MLATPIQIQRRYPQLRLCPICRFFRDDEVDKSCPARLDRFSNTGFLVSRQIVHDHHVAWVERRNPLLTDLGQEQVAVPRAIHHPKSRESIMPQRRHERRRLPVTVWHLADHALPASSATVTTRPLRVGSGFVEEDQVSWVDSQPLGLPPNASRLHVGPILFGCVDHFFLNVRCN